ncbi:hypothetical protein JTE90_014759 [Oedothorax gibbosus]|uniref:Uncharacterized protein n=1 Tax=Oedothorax gibbosus TaxID=931172 RepID=A0AAV6UR13_9ARAC|nr:hypothetical protein JTE90_014759 [Oedothorax gibbosus]
MGSFSSKNKSQMETPIAKPSAFKIIEDPRSPTEEISRTPIEVTDKFMRDTNDSNFSLRVHALKEQNQYKSLDFSPRLRKNELFGKDFKKKSNFASALENETAEPSDLDSTTLMDKDVCEKENSGW